MKKRNLNGFNKLKVGSHECESTKPGKCKGSLVFFRININPDCKHDFHFIDGRVGVSCEFHYSKGNENIIIKEIITIDEYDSFIIISELRSIRICIVLYGI